MSCLVTDTSGQPLKQAAGAQACVSPCSWSMQKANISDVVMVAAHSSSHQYCCCSSWRQYVQTLLCWCRCCCAVILLLSQQAWCVWMILGIDNLGEFSAGMCMLV